VIVIFLFYPMVLSSTKTFNISLASMSKHSMI
jgi:hypothetical protein